MASNAGILIEVIFVFGVVLAWGGYQLWALKRDEDGDEGEGDERGGDERGGDERGGDERGGDERGGDERGG